MTIDPAELFGDPRVADQIAHFEQFPAREARYADPRTRLHPKLQTSLEADGIRQLFTHQAQALDLAMAGKDVVVTTGTNSGKTLCYNLPAIQIGMSEPMARILYLFPTKALAQDQLRRLEKLVPENSLRVGTYDGDTPKTQRSGIRKLCNIVLTNPDMLHVGILPGHEQWVKFLKSLSLIVIDEMHVYRGVFGSNVGNVVRRLLRLCEWHHRRPQIIACSATIGNPLEAFRELTGRQGNLVDDDGAASGRRSFVFWNPPDLGNASRLSNNVATSELLAMLAETNQRTLAFSQARVSAEIVLRTTRKRLAQGGEVEPKAVESYRAGYTPKERREIEQNLFQGKLLGLSATSAMELGVDVGQLDAVVLNGYPGTVSSFWQQAGRAGRGTRDGLAIFVARDDPMEQFLIRAPEMLLNARNESIGLNPENPQILGQHLLCAAQERPIAPSELERFGAKAFDVAEGLDRSGELHYRGGLFYYPAVDSPAMRVNIRSGGGPAVRLLLKGEEIGTMERWRAITTAHPGAVYLHRGVSYLVEALDLEQGIATVLPQEVPFFTRPIVRSVLEPGAAFETAGPLSLCGVTVTEVLEGFQRRSLDGDQVLSQEPLEMPPQTFETIAVRVDLPPLDLEGMPLQEIGGVHGLEHALAAVAPLLAGCDRGDLGTSWYIFTPDRHVPSVYLYDRTPGGVGLAERVFADRTRWLRSACGLLESCPCEDGCPACLLSARCEAGNEPLHKEATLQRLRDLLQVLAS